MSTSTDKSAVGTTVHFTKAMTVHTSTRMGSTALNVAYGDSVFLDEATIEANRDVHGRCRLLELLDDPDGGVRRGAWPEGLSRIERDSPQWDDARAAALQAAAQLPDPDDQRRAVRQAHATYGVASDRCSRTLTEYGPRR